MDTQVISRIASKLLLLFLLIPGSLVIPAVGAADEKGVPLPHVPIDAATAIRFSFQPPNTDFLHPALIFRVAESGSSSMNTAPIGPAGRSPFISGGEMKELMERLRGAKLSWTVTNNVEPIPPYRSLPLRENMEVVIYSSGVKATAEIPSDRLCQVLSESNEAISTPRAKWEFQLFRRMYHCKVVGFDYDAYPDHY